MLTVEDAPSIAAVQPHLEPEYANLSVDGTLVAPVCAPADLRAIRVGDILLAKERGIESWHEAQVRHVGGDLLTLVWWGLPDSEVFSRRVWQVAFLQVREAQG